MINNQNELLLTAKEIIESRQIEAKTKVLELEEQLYKNKEYINLLNKKGDLTIKIAENVKNNVNDNQKLYEELAQNEIEINELLKSLNISPKMLIPQFVCNICNDTGYINGEQCACLKKVYKDLLVNKSNINYNLIPTIEEVDVSVYKGKNAPKIVELLKDLAGDFINKEVCNIILTGNCGVGKTYITQAFAKSLFMKDYSILYLSSFAFNNLLLKLHTSFLDKKNDILDQLLQVDLLIIDDLGTEPIYKNVTIEYLYSIIEQRLSLNKKSLITTNLMPNEISERYGIRISSRIYHKQKSVNMLLDGESLR